MFTHGTGNDPVIVERIEWIPGRPPGYRQSVRIHHMAIPRNQPVDDTAVPTVSTQPWGGGHWLDMVTEANGRSHNGRESWRVWTWDGGSGLDESGRGTVIRPTDRFCGIYLQDAFGVYRSVGGAGGTKMI